MLAATVALSIATASFASPPSCTWTVPGTQQRSLQDVQFSDDPIVPSREVALRTMNADFDSWGPITLYPVVRSPQGTLYYGFVRHYKAGGIGANWTSYTFPEDFRADPGYTGGELDDQYGDGLVDSLIDNGSSLPKSPYQVKRVVNNKLIDTGDAFAYPGFKQTP
jgi:hypothetical protein